MAFFDKTPAGRIVNRVSNDAYNADDQLPYMTHMVFLTFSQFVGQIVNIILSISSLLICTIFSKF